MVSPDQPAEVEGHVPPSDSGETSEYTKHVRDAAHQASQDFDAWVLKLGTAGISVVMALAALVDAESYDLLVWSGAGFAVSLALGLLSLRLSADGLRQLASGTKYADVRQFGLVTFLNWLAAISLAAAFGLLAAWLGTGQIREDQR